MLTQKIAENSVNLNRASTYENAIAAGTTWTPGSPLLHVQLARLECVAPPAPVSLSLFLLCCIRSID